MKDQVALVVESDFRKSRLEYTVALLALVVNILLLSSLPLQGNHQTYFDWVSQFAWDEGNRGSSGDPDRDGLVNVLEYVFDEEPTKPNKGGPLRIYIEEHDGNKYFVIEYKRNLHGTDFNLVPQLQKDSLNSAWSDLAADEYVEEVVEKEQGSDDSFQLVKSSFVMGDGDLFIRMKAEVDAHACRVAEAYGIDHGVIPYGKSVEWTRSHAFSDSRIAWSAVADGAQSWMALRPLEPPFLLPDGKNFKTWELSPKHLRTFHVARNHPSANDENQGTSESPWLTIAKASETMYPGDRVLIHSGTYREWVKPKRGGLGPERMITYQAAEPGVVISGKEIIKSHWQQSSYQGENPENIWQTSVSSNLFSEYNTLQENNIIEQPGLPQSLRDLMDTSPFSRAQVMVFQDGRRLDQVDTYEQLTQKEGRFWLDPGDRSILHVHLFEDSIPEDTTMELSARPFGFAPTQRGLGFVRLMGVTVEGISNVFPVPQKGAISTNQGHHWIIQDCTIRQVNALGLDAGRRRSYLPWEVTSETPLLGGVGHIIRRNRFIDCGICGISGIGLTGCLIEDNHISRTSWQKAWTFENAGIKLLYLNSSLVRGNLIRDTVFKHGLWIDHSSHNSRLTQNVVINSKGVGLYLEASSGENLFDNNIIWSSLASSIRLSGVSNVSVINNLVGAGRNVPYDIIDAPNRIIDLETQETAEASNITMLGQIFYGFSSFPSVPEDGNTYVSDFNYYIDTPGVIGFDLSEWREISGQDGKSSTVESLVTLAEENGSVKIDVNLSELPSVVPRVEQVTRDINEKLREGEFTTQGPFVGFPWHVD